MGQFEKLLRRILAGRSDANLAFEDLRNLLLHLGFQERAKGSHHVFVKAGVEPLINLQREGHLAKAYQVRQVRRVLSRYGLSEEDDHGLQV